MATFSSDILTDTNPAKWFVTDKSAYGTVVIPDNTTLGQGDIIGLCLIPANSQIASFVVDMPDLDSDGRPTITTSLQDNASSPVVYVVDSTAGQAGGNITMENLAAGKLGTSYTAQAQLNLAVTAAATGAISGAKTIYFRVTFTPT